MLSAFSYTCAIVAFALSLFLSAAITLNVKGIKKISIATPFGLEGPAYEAHGDIIAQYYLAAREAADAMGAYSVPLDSLFFKMRGNAPLSECVVTRDGTHPLAPVHEDIAKAIVKAWNM